MVIYIDYITYFNVHILDILYLKKKKFTKYFKIYLYRLIIGLLTYFNNLILKTNYFIYYR